MKRSVALLSIALLMFCVCSAFAQPSRGRGGRLPVDFVKFDSIEGFSDGDGAYLRWSMTVETGNVGFLVYRIGPGGLELVSDGMIVGGIASSSLRPFYGGKYDYYDPEGHLDTAYVIVSQASDGRRVTTASFIPRFTSNFLADTGYTKEFLIEHSRYQGGRIETPSPALTRELTAIVRASRHAPDPGVQRWTVAQPGVKIAVRTEGMYRVSRAELMAAGFPVDSDSTNWRLFSNGIEQAIIVGDGAQYIDFYGRGVDTFETDTAYYYLISDTVAGKRMVSKFLGAIGGNVVANNYRFNTEKKERINYVSSVHNGDTENYFGRAVISDPPVTETVTLNGVDPQGPDAYVQVNIQGFIDGPHSVRVVINGNDFGVLTGNGKTHFGGTFVVPQSLLLEGTNTIALNTLASNDSNLFDSIRVTFSRHYVADQNIASFYTPGYRRANVTGFTSPNIRVFDTSLDGDPQLIVDPVIVQNGSTYTLRMPSNRPAVFYAVEDSALLQSPSVTFDNPSSLATPNNQADMVIISYSSPDFLAASESWANYRRSSVGGGYNVKVVDIQDVFDEFSYGLHKGLAIHDFLAYANSNWQSPRPSYVLIMGDASYDRRNYEGYGNWDMVPTENVSLIYEETGSDDALTDFTSPPDGLADIPIGRIPARDVTSINIALAKTMEFETTANQTLTRGALFAYDIPLGYDFQAMSEILRNQLPSSVPALYVPRGLPEPNPQHLEDPMAHQNLINGINTGKFIVNYAGHGSAGVWDTTTFFQVGHMSELTNAHSETVFTMLTCLNGFFLRPRPTDDSLAEALLKAGNGGAVATWASTTDTTPDYQLTMAIPFFQGLSAGNIPRIGDLIKFSKQSIAGSDVGYSWVLLGDPALKIR